MDLANQKRMAADVLKCGKGRVWMDPTRLEDISDAVTRVDIRKLVKSGAIAAKQRKGVSRVRARFRAVQKIKGRRRGSAHRQGTKYARFPRKARWMARIRPIRARLCELRDGKTIERSVYRRLYRQAKGGMFHNRGHLETQLRLRGIVKDELIPSKKAEVRRKKRRDAIRSLLNPSQLVRKEKKEKKPRASRAAGPKPGGHAPAKAPVKPGEPKSAARPGPAKEV